MWTIEVYRSARELVSVWQDMSELYSIVAEICKKREDAPPEIELTTRFRECCGLVHEEEPLFFSEPEPHDTGWTVIGERSPREEGGTKNSEEATPAGSSEQRPMGTCHIASNLSSICA